MLGSSDHNTILLIPIIKSGTVASREVEMWTGKTVEELKGAFESADWNAFNNSAADLDERAEVVSSFILYLKDSIIPTKCVKVFPNNKPWLDKVVKDALHRNTMPFCMVGLRIRYKLKTETRYEMKRAKLQYKSRIE